MARFTFVLSTLFSAAVSLTYSQTVPIETCLSEASLPATFPNSTTWANDTAPWSLRIKPKPSAVVKPTEVSQIVAALTCASAANVKVAARNGGHSYGSYGVGGNDGALVINMDAFQETSFDASTGLLKFGGGAIVGDVITWAWKTHGVHFPHVRANRIGLAGSSIGGGFGSTSRFLGTPMSQLESVEYLLYNGTIVNASRTENPDLFWVAQGAGSSYGILLSLTTKTWKPTYPQVTNFTITLGTNDTEAGVQALLAIQEYGRSDSCPDELSLRWMLTAPPYTGSGFFYGDPAAFNASIEPLMANLPEGTTLKSAVADFWTMENIATPDLEIKKNTYPPRNFYLQALVLRRDQGFTYESAKALYQYTTLAFNRTDLTKFGFIDLWGGVSRDVRDTDSSFAYQDSLFLIRWEGRLATGLTEFPADGISYMQKGLQPFQDQLAAENIPLRGFVNYRDTELTVDEWSQRLYAGNWQRMLNIKAVTDPKGIFSTNPQSIPMVGSI
ncbi:hypothetical protein QTJ16_006659 [Diplocarpon rosae]|uniref:FAD-binding PCMH-type domain-containing protein n=1 Tax=Diplocarpon rosae TaxID=946125 RepID=A0AAD9SUM2_9HELO|nr:hypothetical protein QTJ16_006659 [Diplocarpon rosae]